jgi:hypothetical protein
MEKRERWYSSILSRTPHETNYATLNTLGMPFLTVYSYDAQNYIETVGYAPLKWPIKQSQRLHRVSNCRWESQRLIVVREGVFVNSRWAICVSAAPGSGAHCASVACPIIVLYRPRKNPELRKFHLIIIHFHSHTKYLAQITSQQVPLRTCVMDTRYRINIH